MEDARTPRVVLVTGASAGIGRSCAARLHTAGWSVFGASRRGTAEGEWTPLVMDVDRDDSVQAGVDALVGQAGRLDAVVACAGWGLAGAVEQTSIADAHEQLETNFWGAVRVVGRALPVMRAERAGRVVLISSIGGIVALPFQAFYSASKFAMEGYGEALAYEVAPFGIQVTLVEPGNVRTDFTANRRDAVAPAGDDPYRRGRRPGGHQDGRGRSARRRAGQRSPRSWNGCSARAVPRGGPRSGRWASGSGSSPSASCPTAPSSRRRRAASASEGP